MSSLVLPHGGNLVSRLVEGKELVEAQRRARELPMVRMTSRETS